MGVHPTRTVSLEHVRVRDCMHSGILSCPPDAPISDVARIMAGHRVHAVAVAGRRGGRPLGIVTDMDVISAAAGGAEPSAHEAADTRTVSVSADESLRRAAQLMNEHAVAHLVVLDSASGYPIGVLSTLDVAAVFGGR